MGVDLEIWRCRTGTFCQPRPREKWKVPTISPPPGEKSSAVFRILVLSAVFASASAFEGMMGLAYHVIPSGVLVPEVWYSSQYEMCCGAPLAEVNTSWSSSIHSAVTRACSADIEVNPGPGPEKKGAWTDNPTIYTQTLVNKSWSRTGRQSIIIPLLCWYSTRIDLAPVYVYTVFRVRVITPAMVVTPGKQQRHDLDHPISRSNSKPDIGSKRPCTGRQGHSFSP